MLGKYEFKIQREEGYKKYYDYSENIQLPINITEAADQTYDTASVTIKRTIQYNPFKAGTSAVIIIKNENDEQIKYYDMIIESDFVEEEYEGTDAFYNHTITLIERTKLLDGIMLQNFSVTNPATIATKQDFNYQKELIFNKSLTGSPDGENDNRWAIFPSYRFVPGMYKVIKDFKNGFSAETSYLRWYKEWSGAGYGFTYLNFSVSKIATKIIEPELQTYSYLKKYMINDEISLPTIYTDDTLCKVGILLYSDTLGEAYVTGSFSTISIPLAYLYEYSIDNKKTWNKLILLSKYSNEYFSSIEKIYDTEHIRKDGVRYLFKPAISGKYNIRIKMIFPGMSDEEEYYSQFSRFYKDILLYFFKNQIVTVFDTDKKKIEMQLSDFLENKSPSDTIFNFPLMPPEEPFPITSLAQLDEATRDTFELSFEVSDESSQEEYTYKTVREIAQKAINMIPPSYGSFSLVDSPKLSTIVPEKTFIGRNAAEILFELGSLINSYPELDAQNRISFNSVVPEDSYTKGASEYITFSDDLENRATSYYTDIRNMISIPDGQRLNYSYWPAKDLFSYMNGTESGASIKPDGSAITLYNSDGIYKLISFKVTNILTDDFTASNGIVIPKDIIVDITKFTHEKTFYQTLYANSSSASGAYPWLYKSNSLFWTKGKNEINLGELPDSDKIGMFGEEIAPEMYQLQNAIYEALVISIGERSDALKEKIKARNMTEYKFQICFIDTFQTVLKTEKFNINNDERNIDINYNQQNNNITEDFKDIAQIDILRRGNYDFNKPIQVTNIGLLPKLGETTERFSKTYFADNISYNFDNNICTCLVNYTNNYSKINRDISISKEYRQFEIYADNIVRRNIPIDFYMYMSLNNPISKDALGFGVSDYRGKIITGEWNYKPLFCSSLRGNPAKTPRYAILYFKDKNKNTLKYTISSDIGSASKNVEPIVVPISYKTKGNSIVLYSKLNDNYAAKYERGDTLLKYKDAWNQIKDNAYSISDERYVDDNGEAAFVSYYILHPEIDEYIVKNGKAHISEENLLKYYRIYIGKRDIEINKDNREALSFTCQIHFVSNNERIKWHPALCKYFLAGDEEPGLVTKETLIPDGSVIENSEYLPKYIGSRTRLQGETVLNYENEDILSEPEFGKGDYILRKENIYPEVDYKNVALVYPKTREILYHLDLPLYSTASNSIPAVYFTLLDKKINNLI